MIRDCKICILVSTCNAYIIDSEITIVTFVLNSIFPLYEYQYVSNHSLQYFSTFLYLLFIIPLLLIIVYVVRQLSSRTRRSVLAVAALDKSLSMV